MATSFLPCELRQAKSVGDRGYDCVLLVVNDNTKIAQFENTKSLAPAVNEYLKLDSGLNENGCALISISTDIVPSGRLVISHTQSTNTDFDDVRRYANAATEGMKKVLSAGSVSPLLVTIPFDRFPMAEVVCALGALYALHVPLQVKEMTDKKYKAKTLGLLTSNDENVKLVEGLETGRTVTRDIAGSDPERMTPIATAQYIKEAFGKESAVKIEIVEDQDVIKSQFPLMASVNRAANVVARHQARLISLEYIPEGKIEETLMLVGKGVTIDTGGTDLKVNGAMWGMSRDKTGSAVVAGFFKVLDVLRPKGLKVLGYMCMVRNSIGEESYTCDEIIKARSGKRIRIVNTDAEGRITMLDPLCKMTERAVHEINPHIMTIATLTGHAALTAGEGFCIALDNGPALYNDFCYKLQKESEKIGDPFEVSRFRSEDFAFHKAQSEYADLRQGNTLPSTRTERGHQTPGAFLILGSGLDKHGMDSKQPIKFTHIDMAGAEGPWPGVPLGQPVAALAAQFVLPRL